MRKIGGKWVGDNPTEQIKLEKARLLRRKAYKIFQSVDDGNRVLEEFDKSD